MRRRHLAAVTVAAALATMGLAACGDDSSDASASPSTSSAGTSTSTEPSGDAIKIGNICSCTGAQAAALGKASAGMEAWVKHINDNGGLNGHPVTLVTKDDGGDPAKGIQSAKELVEKEKVVAIVGMTSLTDQAWAKIVDDAKVPVVGGYGPELSFMTDPNFFASGSNSVVATFGMLQEAKKAGATKVGVLYCSESPVCGQINGIGTPFANLLGLGYESAAIAATQPNYLAQCLKLKGDGVDTVFIAHNSSVGVRVGADCRKAGYEPRYINQLSAIASDTITSPDFAAGITMSTSNAVYSDENLPGAKEFIDAAEAYQSGITDDPAFNQNAFFAWGGGKLFEAAAKAVDLAPTSTPADVYKGLYMLKDETLGGTAPPLTFTDGKPAFPTCYFAAEAKDGEVAPLYDNNAVCLTPEQLQAMQPILAALAG